MNTIGVTRIGTRTITTWDTERMSADEVINTLLDAAGGLAVQLTYQAQQQQLRGSPPTPAQLEAVRRATQGEGDRQDEDESSAELP